MIASLLLFGEAIALRDVLPVSLRILMVVGGVALLIDHAVQENRLRRDPGSDYPYLAQANTVDDRQGR